MRDPGLRDAVAWHGDEHWWLTTLPPPAAADVGFWRSAGLRGVDAFGVYLVQRPARHRVRPASVRVSFLLKDLRADGRTAAVRLTFTGRHHRRSVRVVALPAGEHQRWRVVRSANAGHLYVQECTGAWRKSTRRKQRFRVGVCAPRRRRY